MRKTYQIPAGGRQWWNAITNKPRLHEVEVEETLLVALETEAKHQHPEESDEQIRGRALARALVQEHKIGVPNEKEIITELRGIRKILLWFGWAIVLLLLLLGLLALPVRAQVDVLRVQDEGTTVKQWAGGLASLNFTGGGITCSFSAGPPPRVNCNVPTGGGGASWDALTNPLANQSLAMGAFTSTWTWNATTGVGANLFNLTDTLNNTGTGYGFNLNTASGSALKPWRVCYRGTTNCIVVDTSILTVTGSAQINATHINGVTVTGTPANGQVPIASSGTAAAWGDPIVSGPAAEGATPVNNPVWVSGKGADGFIHSIRMANDGTVRIDPTGTTTQPVSGTVTTTPPANASTNVAQLAGTATDTNSGLKSAGTLRVVIATDQPQLTNKLLVTPDSVALPANQSVNVAQINAVTPLMGNGVTGTGSQRVTIASDNTAFAVNATLSAETTKVIGTVRTQGNLGAAFDAATGAAPPANAVLRGGLASGATGGFVTASTVCDSFANINVVTITTTLLVTGVSGRHVRICSWSFMNAGANNVAFISGTGATCATGTTGMNGGTTAATGFNFAANQGMTQGSGLGEINRTNATGDSVCVITSAAVQLSGRISYAIY